MQFLGYTANNALALKRKVFGRPYLNSQARLTFLQPLDPRPAFFLTLAPADHSVIQKSHVAKIYLPIRIRWPVTRRPIVASL